MPPRLGATFAIGDGVNDRGGLTFYEIRVRQGRVWSTGALFEFDCAASGEFKTCREHEIEGMLEMGPVQHVYGHSGISFIEDPENNGGDERKGGNRRMGHDDALHADGTKVMAYMAIPPAPSAPNMASTARRP